MKAKLKYYLTCSFRDGNRKVVESRDSIDGGECVAAAAEWLEVPLRDGVPYLPKLSELRSNLGRYCDDSYIRRERARLKSAAAAADAVRAFVETGRAGAFGREVGRSEFILVEAVG